MRSFSVWLIVVVATLTACRTTPTAPATPTAGVISSPVVVATTASPATAAPTNTTAAVATTTLPTATPPPTAPPATPTPATIREVDPQRILLNAPLDEADAELSGMAWYSDTLVMLPQFPAQYGGQLFGLSEAEILTYLDTAADPPTALTPRPIPFDDGNLHQTIRGFEGYEAIAFHDNRVFVTIEVRLTLTTMTGYLVAGTVVEDGAIRLDPATMTELPAPVALENYSDEAIVMAGDRLFTLYEANGANVNPNAMARQFDLETLAAAPTLPLAPLEYRLTDATPTDSENRFWVINYLFPGDTAKLNPAPDPFRERYGEGASHARDLAVERLIEMEITADGIVPTDTPPLYLELALGTARNWEGIVRLDGRGFLLASDKFPTTLLSFVPYP